MPKKEHIIQLSEIDRMELQDIVRAIASKLLMGNNRVHPVRRPLWQMKTPSA
jgi:hypothetical protein